MQVTIDINDELYKELIEKDLKDLPSEKVQEILIQSLTSYLSDGNNAEKVFTRKAGRYYSDSALELSDTLMNVIKKSINIDDVSIEISNIFVQYIRENAERLIPDMLARIFIKGIAENNSFVNSIRSSIVEDIPQISSMVASELKRRS